MAWLYLLFAGLLEIVWAFYMKQSAGFTRLVPTVVTLVTMVMSFALLSVSMRTLPLGTAYAVWTGIGAIGTFIVGILLLGESTSVWRIASGLLIVAGVIGLRLTSSE